MPRQLRLINTVDGYYSTKEAAFALNVSYKTFKKYCKLGLIKAINENSNRPLYSKKDIEECFYKSLKL